MTVPSCRCPLLPALLLMLASAAEGQPLRPGGDAAAPAVPAADRGIYRCRALDGSALFQDRPCHLNAGTLEAREGGAGERLDDLAAPPAEDGAVAAARYRRYLEQLAAERRIAADADLARAERLKAEAALEAARSPPAAEAGGAVESERWLPLYLPRFGRPIHRPPVIAPPPPAPPSGPRPTRPPPREPRDVRAETLDTRR
ncbi:hypothetical protein [Nevskia sp.]|uniref:hypothetical protein n=1 Tax=Nevskia sp. TaxID=1929292 RepID=UPI003F6FD3DC